MSELFAQEEVQQNGHKKARERSRNYPGIPLERVIDFAQEFKTKVGVKTSVKAVTDTFGVKKANSGTISIKLGSLRQFGLLEGRAENLILSDLAKKILVPVNQDTKTQAIREAFLKPDLYQELANDFNNESIPEGLANLLFHKYGITEAGKENAAKCFVESARFAGFLRDDGIFVISEGVGSEDKPVADPSLETTNQFRSDLLEKMPPSPVPNGEQSMTISLTGQRRAVLMVPHDVNMNDLEILKAQIEVLGLRIRLNQQETQAHEPPLE